MRKKTKTTSTAQRHIDPSYLKRAESVDTQQLREYLDSSVVALHQAVDQWRYHKGQPEDVNLCLDAIIAMWSVLESRAGNNEHF